MRPELEMEAAGLGRQRCRRTLRSAHDVSWRTEVSSVAALTPEGMKFMHLSRDFLLPVDRICNKMLLQLLRSLPGTVAFPRRIRCIYRRSQGCRGFCGVALF
jgi:hypothetical protein